MQFVHRGKTFTGYFAENKYVDNNNLYVALMSWQTDGGYWEPYANVSVNTDLWLPADEFVAKTYSENEGLVGQFVAMGYFEETGLTTRFGYVGAAPIYRITKKFKGEAGQVPTPPARFSP